MLNSDEEKGRKTLKVKVNKDSGRLKSRKLNKEEVEQQKEDEGQ